MNFIYIYIYTRGESAGTHILLESYMTRDYSGRELVSWSTVECGERKRCRTTFVKHLHFLINGIIATQET